MPQPSSLRLTDLTFCRLLGDLAGCVGAVDFEEKMLALLRRTVRHDWASMTRYKRHGPPDYLIVQPEGSATTWAKLYLERYYSHDPFLRYWREKNMSGLVSVHQLPTRDPGHGRYVRELMVPSGVSDEVGLFLPAMGGACLALFLERRNGRFRPHELTKLRQLYPILSGLQRGHLVALLGGGPPSDQADQSSPLASPTAIFDSELELVQANEAWHKEAFLSDKIPRSALRSKQPVEINLGNGIFLQGERLPENFRLAPNGSFWVAERQTSSNLDKPLSAPDTEALFAGELTPREHDIVGLILQGYPSAVVAERLGLSRGTVKNHRRRIYDKLDITSERELFLTYIDRLHGGPP